MADFTTPMLIITNAGLAAASVATPVGPFIHITKFQIGSAFGYTPTKDDLSINGELLFEGAPLTYKYVGENTIDIVCRLPAEAGPFEFGEVALFLDGNVMFAKAAFADAQIKYSSLGTNVLSTYTFNCLLKLDQAVAVFKIDTNCKPPDIWEVDLWSDVYPAGLSANPDIPSILVHELDANGNATLITRASDTHWSMAGNYRTVNQATVVGSTTGRVDINTTEVVNMSPSALNREYVIETADGYIRSVNNVVAAGAGLRLNINGVFPTAPPVGSVVTISSMSTNQTLLNVVGDITGSVLLKGPSATISVTLDQAAVRARSLRYDTAGVYTSTIPDGASFFYIDAGGAGGGGGGAGGGWNVDHITNEEYRAGGGGGGGGVAQTTSGFVLPVVPGDILEVTVGAKGAGGTSGAAPGGNGGDGGTGGSTIVKINGATVLTLAGGAGGVAGGGFGPPSGGTGAGGGGGAGGSAGADGYFGGGGGNGGSSEFGTGGGGARGATGGAPGSTGIPGGAAAGNCAGGGGGGAIYIDTSTLDGGPGGEGSDGIFRATW